MTAEFFRMVSTLILLGSMSVFGAVLALHVTTTTAIIIQEEGR